MTTETINKKKFLISVSKFKNHVKHDCDKLRNTSITVYATDEVEAIQMHNEIFNNYKDVENYLIIGNLHRPYFINLKL